MTTEIVVEHIGCEELLVTVWIHGGGMDKYCWVPGGELRFFGKTEGLCKVEDEQALLLHMRNLYKAPAKIKRPLLTGEIVPLRDEITEVRMGPIEAGVETFTFKLRGVLHKACQAGRLRDLCLGHSDDADHRIAAMAIADGLASKLEEKADRRKRVAPDGVLLRQGDLVEPTESVTASYSEYGGRPRMVFEPGMLGVVRHVDAEMGGAQIEFFHPGTRSVEKCRTTKLVRLAWPAGLDLPQDVHSLDLDGWWFCGSISWRSALNLLVAVKQLRPKYYEVLDVLSLDIPGAEVSGAAVMAEVQKALETRHQIQSVDNCPLDVMTTQGGMSP